MVLLEFSMAPLTQGESVGDEVARILDVIDRSGVPYELHAMGTLLEGEWDEVMAVVKSCYEEMRQRCPRITVTLKMDIREGAQGRLSGKVDAIERRLGRRLHTGT